MHSNQHAAARLSVLTGVPARLLSKYSCFLAACIQKASILMWRAGDEEKSRIVVEYARRFQPRPRVLGTWTVPLKHVIRCAGR